MTTPADVLRAAAAEIGTTESPAGSNRNKYSAALGRPAEPWCADFQVWVARQAGLKLPSESAYTPSMFNGFLAAGLGKRGTAGVRPGDLVFFNFGSGGIRHVGIVEQVKQSELVTIEGNTSSGNVGSQDNGGGVYRRARPYSYVVGYGRPAYTSEVRPMYDPALALEPIVADLACPTGGAWLLAASGAVYAFGGAPYLGAANGKDYFAGRKAARLNLVDGQYQIVATSGETYGPGF